MKISARAIVTLTLLALLPLAIFALRGTSPTSATAQTAQLAESPNVERLPPVVGGQTAAISGVFSRSAPFFYVSGLDSLTVFDVSDPRKPVVKGKLANAIFENEAMTLGERVGPDGKIKRFVLLGADLYQVGPGGITRADPGANALGMELIVVDVTDPAAPDIIGRGPATTSTHTVACANADCTIAYTAGTGTKGNPGGGKFSIFDLSDLTKPKEIKTAPSSAAGPDAAFTTGAGHYWNFDGAGIGWHTGSGGTEAFDISDPVNPVPLNGTDANGTTSPYNDFIHHNSQRPNARAFKPGQPLSVENGNVVLITEEDYFNRNKGGEELACDKAGTFQTWEIPDLDGAAYRANNPGNLPSRGNFHVLDTINAPNEGAAGSAPRPARSARRTGSTPTRAASSPRATTSRGCA